MEGTSTSSCFTFAYLIDCLPKKIWLIHYVTCSFKSEVLVLPTMVFDPMASAYPPTPVLPLLLMFVVAFDGLCNKLPEAKASKQYTFIFYHFRVQKSKISLTELKSVCQQGWFLWRLWGGNSFPCLLHLQEATCIPWLVAPSSHHSGLYFCVHFPCSFWASFLPLMRTHVTTIGWPGQSGIFLMSRSLM